MRRKHNFIKYNRRVRAGMEISVKNIIASRQNAAAFTHKFSKKLNAFCFA